MRTISISSLGRVLAASIAATAVGPLTFWGAVARASDALDGTAALDEDPGGTEGTGPSEDPVEGKARVEIGRRVESESEYRRKVGPPGVNLLPPTVGGVPGALTGGAIPVSPETFILSKLLVPAEAIELGRILAVRADATDADLRRVAGIIDTPEHVAGLITAQIRTDADETVVTGALQVYRSGGGGYESVANFGSYLLQVNGYDARVVTYGAPGRNHAVVAFSDAEGAGIMEDDVLWRMGTEDWTQLLATIIPDAWRFQVADEIASPEDPAPTPYRTVETQQGLLVKEFIHEDAYVPRTPGLIPPGAPGPGAPGAGRWEEVGATSEHATLSAGMGKWELDARYFYPSDMQTSNALGLAGRLHLTRRLALSVGLVGMPQSFNYSVVERDRSDEPMVALFLGATGAWTLYEKGFGADARLRFSSEADLRAALVPGFAGAGVDEGTLEGLSHVDGTSRNRLGFRLADHWQLHLGQDFYLPMVDVGHFIYTGGTLGHAPFSTWSEAGIRYADGSLMLGLNAFVPEQIRTNLLADEPLGQFEAAWRPGDAGLLYFTVAAGADGVNAAYLGGRWTRYGVGAFVGVGPNVADERQVRFGASIDVSVLVQAHRAGGAP